VSGFTIEETVHVAAPPEAVWKLLVDTHTWRLWWPGCVEAESRDRKLLRDGSRFSLRLKLGWILFAVSPKVEAATPPRSLVWSGTGAGLTGRHAFYLDARPNGTFVRQQESFSGPGLFVFRLLRLDRATQRMFHDNLRGLKRLAERAV
jgi:uncharacterized protein YndB with AHSA1/START domain